MNFRGGASPKTATFTAQADLLILMTETDAADMNVSIREKLQNQGASLLGFCLFSPEFFCLLLFCLNFRSLVESESTGNSNSSGVFLEVKR